MEKLLLIPGPSPVVPRILAALAAPTVSHVGPDHVADLRSALDDLKRFVYCRDGQPFLVAGAGTLAMEIAVLNTVGPDDRLLVLSQGFFGDRMAEIAASFGLAHDVLRSSWGQVVPPEEMLRAVAEKGSTVVACTHVDTGTGACAPVRAYAEALRSRGLLFIVDGVCATGGLEERMDDWGIDVILSAAQKCFGAPPGLALDVFSVRALEKRRRLGRVPAYYSDILRWLPIMQDPARYFSTPCVNEMRAFAEACRIMREEGLEARFVRQARLGAAVRAGLRTLGFGLFTDEACLADTLSVVLYPEGVPDVPFRTLLSQNGVVVAGGLGPTAGRVFRMGHMGNLSEAQVLEALAAVETTLRGLGHPFEAGLARTAAAAALAR
jgi:alanine-glyoxylate transaminase / serine-glyoxylate transaminase / serine-pyruvate transaminase